MGRGNYLAKISISRKKSCWWMFIHNVEKWKIFRQINSSDFFSKTVTFTNFLQKNAWQQISIISTLMCCTKFAFNHFVSGGTYEKHILNWFDGTIVFLKKKNTKTISALFLQFFGYFSRKNGKKIVKTEKTEKFEYLIKN